MPLTGDQTGNLGMSPEEERTLTSWFMGRCSTNEPHQPGPLLNILTPVDFSPFRGIMVHNIWLWGTFTYSPLACGFYCPGFFPCSWTTSIALYKYNWLRDRSARADCLPLSHKHNDTQESFLPQCSMKTKEIKAEYSQVYHTENLSLYL